MNNRTYNLAVTALFVALQIIFLEIAFLFDTLTISMNILAAIAMMMPLSRKMYKESLLAYIAVSILIFILTGFPNCLTYILFSGLYTILTIFLYNKKVNYLITLPLKILWANVVFYLFYNVLIGFIVIDFTFLNINMNYWLLALIVSVLICIYDKCLLIIYNNIAIFSGKIFKG